MVKALPNDGCLQEVKKCERTGNHEAITILTFLLVIKRYELGLTTN